MKYKFIEHTADVKFEAYGKSLEEAFSNSAEAMIKSITEDQIKKVLEKSFEVEGNDYESLFYEFLEEILFIFESENLIFSGIKEIKINAFNLKCVAYFDYSKNYDFFSHVKAVTYNEMNIEKDNGHWILKAVLDV